MDINELKARHLVLSGLLQLVVKAIFSPTILAYRYLCVKRAKCVIAKQQAESFPVRNDVAVVAYRNRKRK